MGWFESNWHCNGISAERWAYNGAIVSNIAHYRSMLLRKPQIVASDQLPWICPFLCRKKCREHHCISFLCCVVKHLHVMSSVWQPQCNKMACGHCRTSCPPHTHTVILMGNLILIFISCFIWQHSFPSFFCIILLLGVVEPCEGNCIHQNVAYWNQRGNYWRRVNKWT